MGEIRRWDTPHYSSLAYHQKISEELYLTLCGRERCAASQHVGPVARDGYHLHVILSGRGYYETSCGLFSLHAGQMFMIHPEETVTYYADGDNPWSYCWLAFDGEKADYYAELAGFGPGVYWRDCHVDPERFLKIAEKMIQNMKPSISSVLQRTAVMYEYLALAAESHIRSGHGDAYQQVFMPDMYVDYAVELIKKNYSHITVEELAQYVGINRSYLSDIFKKKLGMPPQHYLVRYRMDRGGELLRTTELPIQEVAKRSGYDNPLTFTKMFKKTYGVSPREYRIRMAVSGGLPDGGENEYSF